MNNSNDFTYDKVNYEGLPGFVEELHKNGRHYIPLVDPGVSAGELKGSYPPYDMGIKMDIFVKNSSGQPFIGKVLTIPSPPVLWYCTVNSRCGTHTLQYGRTLPTRIQ